MLSVTCRKPAGRVCIETCKDTILVVCCRSLYLFHPYEPTRLELIRKLNQIPGPVVNHRLDHRHPCCDSQRYCVVCHCAVSNFGEQVFGWKVIGDDVLRILWDPNSQSIFQRISRNKLSLYKNIIDNRPPATWAVLMVTNPCLLKPFRVWLGSFHFVTQGAMIWVPPFCSRKIAKYPKGHQVVQHFGWSTHLCHSSPGQKPLTTISEQISPDWKTL